MPHIPSPTEYVFPPTEAPISVTHSHLLLHQVQVGGSEACHSGANATHMYQEILKDAAPVISSLGAIDLEVRLISIRRKTLKDIVLEAPLQP